MAKTASPKKKSGPVAVDSIRHKDDRVNIPTKELRGFVKEDEEHPKSLQYPRDPSLDPQLVWKGKDEQDRADLEVPVVPIYIQEKIHPQAIIEDLKSQTAAGQDAPQFNMFADFNGIGDDFSKRIDFYSHDVHAHWTNRMILGDSLLVMSSLAEKEGLRGKVQCIYLDPPYGIKFGSNWQVSTRKRDVKDGKAEEMSREPEQVKAFRDTWQLGIHSYLAYLRDRLVVARDLLTETGSVFVQIGDENVHLVRNILDEVFGSENFCSEIMFKKTSGQASELLAGVGDFIIWYARNKSNAKFRKIYETLGKEISDESYNCLQTKDGSWRRLSGRELSGHEPPPEGIRFRTANLTSQGATKEGSSPFSFEGKVYSPAVGTHWKPSRSGLEKLAHANRLVAVGNTLAYKREINDFPVVSINNIWTDTIESTFAVEKFYVVQTAVKVIQRCVLMTTDPGDLVLDPTCGSGTTAYVAEQWGRRWITCDTSRVALALARTRLMAAKYPYYLLSDTTEGQKKEAEVTGLIPPDHKTDGDIRKGFVYKRVPHVTLGSIANNPDIKEGMTRQEIDAAIMRYADTEMLFDQPYEDNKRLRVCGPFTVESLSPHRILATDEERPVSETEGQRDSTAAQFETIVIDNLKKAGVQNTKKGERLKFDNLSPYAGMWIHATGDYEDADGKTRRVAVSIGPEHGTVGTNHIREAAKEAVAGLGYDLLIVCGYAFDPHVGEEIKSYGKLTVLPVRINADLAMGDELLKKTGSGNLFMVFGEPDIDIKTGKDGVTVTINGVDIYDPTTGAIRSSDTNEIACWFIDTNYNGESFFVRHAYFTGADEPYDKLKRALRAEVDEAAWSSLYSTTSRPFDKPKTGKIAVKVINHYGDEVLKVYEIR